MAANAKLIEPKLTGSKDDGGLFRSLLAGPGHSLQEAFANLLETDRVDFAISHPTLPIIGASIELLESEGEGYWNFFAFDNDLFLIVGDFTYLHPRAERLPGDGLLEFHIRLNGQLTLSTHRNEAILVDGPSLLVWDQPEGCEAQEHVGSGSPDQSITIYCTPEYFTDSVIGDTRIVPEQLNKVLYTAQDRIGYCQLPLNSELLQSAGSLFGARSRMPAELWLVYARAKAAELLCLIVSAFDHLVTASEHSFSDADISRIRQAHEVLSTHFDPRPTIAQLARTIGINDTKLKQGFKSLYGMTVFEFGHKCRMQHAMELLKAKQLPVGLVAEQIGYQHQTTFTTAFRSYFGICPKDVRKLRRSTRRESMKRAKR